MLNEDHQLKMNEKTIKGVVSCQTGGVNESIAEIIERSTFGRLVSNLALSVYVDFIKRRRNRLSKIQYCHQRR